MNQTQQHEPEFKKCFQTTAVKLITSASRFEKIVILTKKKKEKIYSGVDKNVQNRTTVLLSQNFSDNRLFYYLY